MGSDVVPESAALEIHMQTDGSYVVCKEGNNVIRSSSIFDSGLALGELTAMVMV